jgi:hypothetical protein
MKKKGKIKANFPKANEPDVQYQSNNIEVYSSFEEENEATAKLNALRTPEENFMIAHQIIKAMYHEEIKNMPDPPYSRITFTMIDGLPV